MHKGRVVFGAMDEVVFGRSAAEAVVAQMDRLHAARAFLMVSGTLNRQTGEIEKIRQALGNRCVATFDAMPPHTPREAVIAASEGAQRVANRLDRIGLPVEGARDHQEGARRPQTIHLRDNGLGGRLAEHDLVHRAERDTPLVHAILPAAYLACAAV